MKEAETCSIGVMFDPQSVLEPYGLMRSGYRCPGCEVGSLLACIGSEITHSWLLQWFLSWCAQPAGPQRLEIP